MKEVKIKPLEYREGGIFKYISRDFEYVTIDNKVFEYCKVVHHEIDLDADFNGERKMDWDFTEYDELKPYGYVIKIWRINGFLYKESFKNPIEWAFKFGDIDTDFIKDVYYGKIGQGNYRDYADYCISENEIMFPVGRYGWNNTINITIPLPKFLQIRFDKHYGFAQQFIEDCFKHIFPKCYFDSTITELQTIKLLQEIFEKQIKFKNQRL